MAQGKKRKFNFFVRVADIGLFQGIIQTRARLMIAAFVATGLALGVIVAGSEWMRSTSGSSMMNVLAISSMLTVLIVAAYIDALLIGDLFFPGKWRERVLLGEEVDLDESIDPTTIKEYNPHFMIVLIASIFGLFWLSQKVSDGYIWYYEDVGFAVTLMRSEDPDERLFGLTELANPIREPVWQHDDIHAQITRLVDDPDVEVQTKAMYVAGRLDVTRSAERLLHHFRETDDARVRAAAAIALGRLKWKTALPHLSSWLAHPDVTEDEAVAILRGFSLYGKPEVAGPAAVSLLERCKDDSGERLPESVVIHAFYVLQKTLFEGGRDIAKRYLDGGFCEPSLQERCSAANALRYIATPEDIPYLKRTFDDVGRDDVCEYDLWKYHKEATVEIIDADPLRAKIVRAVGNRKDYDTYEWIWKIGADEDEHPKTRKAAEIYTTEMYQAYQEEQARGKR